MTCIIWKGHTYNSVGEYMRDFTMTEIKQDNYGNDHIEITIGFYNYYEKENETMNNREAIEAALRGERILKEHSEQWIEFREDRFYWQDKTRVMGYCIFDCVGQWSIVPKELTFKEAIKKPGLYRRIDKGYNDTWNPQLMVVEEEKLYLSFYRRSETHTKLNIVDSTRFGDGARYVKDQ